MNKDTISPKVYASIIATGLMSFCGVLVETAMNVAFPTLMRDFHVSTNVVQWMTSIALLAVSIIVPISAALKSTYKTKSLFLVSNFLFLIGLLIDATALNFWILLFGRVIQGIGTGIALPLMFNIILEQVPKHKIGMMMGFGNMITGIAPALGPTFGGIVLHSLGWRSIFWLLIPIVLISLGLGTWGIQQSSTLRKVTIDKLSFVAIAVFFTSMIFGFSNLGTGSFLTVLLPIIIAILFAWLLIWRSSRIEEPILKLSLLKQKDFSGHVLGFFLIQILNLGNGFLLPNFIQQVNGNDALIAGLIILPAGIAGAVMSPLGGKLLDVYGAHKPILIGTSMMLVETAIFSLFTAQMSNTFIMLVYIIYMAGMGMAIGDVMTDTLSVIDIKESAQGNAILNTTQQFAGAVGTSITSAIVTISQKQYSSIASGTRIGTQHAYILLFILAIIIVATFIRFAGKKQK